MLSSDYSLFYTRGGVSCKSHLFSQAKSLCEALFSLETICCSIPAGANLAKVIGFYKQSGFAKHIVLLELYVFPHQRGCVLQKS